MLVDSHCHLDFPDFAEELDDVVARAHDAGVSTIQTICTRMTEFDKVRDVAGRYDNMYCSIGVHPHNVESEGVVRTADIVAKTDDPKVIGIGETGLDFYYDHSPREQQKASFRQHIAASRQTGLPLIVHTRDADDDTMDILEDEMGKGASPGLIHCFSSSRELCERSLAIGLFISISGIATFKSAQELRDTITDVPLDRLLVETDAPYLAPVPKRGKRNEPAFVRHTAAVVADLKAVSEDELARVTTDNFFNLFSKAKRPDT
ncbi:MAG: TatD family hydrolase [Rhodospirillales bacterium]|nr:TatD family hydrolase [Rhodospirillales bacterium]